MSNAKAQMAREIREAPRAVARQEQSLAQPLAELVARLQARAPQVVVTCARGSSAHAAAFAKHLIERYVGVPGCSRRAQHRQHLSPVSASEGSVVSCDLPIREKRGPHRHDDKREELRRADDCPHQRPRVRRWLKPATSCCRSAPGRRSAWRQRKRSSRQPRRSPGSRRCGPMTTRSQPRSAACLSVWRQPPSWTGARPCRRWPLPRASSPSAAARRSPSPGRPPSSLRRHATGTPRPSAGPNSCTGPWRSLRRAIPYSCSCRRTLRRPACGNSRATLRHMGAALFVAEPGEPPPRGCPRSPPDQPEADAICMIQSFYGMAVQLAQHLEIDIDRPPHLRKVTSTT